MLNEIILFSSLLTAEAPPNFSSFAVNQIKAEKVAPDPPIFKHREVLDKFKPDVKIKKTVAPQIFRAQDKFGQVWESQDKNALDAFINSRNAIIINPPVAVPYAQPQSFNPQPCPTLTG